MRRGRPEGQRELFDRAAGSSTARRLFFALHPDEAACVAIATLASRLHRSHGLRDKQIPPERLHLTVDYLGQYSPLTDEVVAAACAAAQALSIQQFTVGLHRAGSFSTRPGNHPFVLLAGEGAQAVLALQRELDLALTRNGLRTRPQSGIPHVTISYQPRCIEEHPIELISWLVRELVLIESLVGKGEHITRGRWALRH